jgi:transposase-like protein
MSSQPNYRGYRFPAEIISHTVWLYHRFTLSLHDIEDLLAERNIIVSYESIRRWCATFRITLRRLPETNVPGCAGFWFVFKARWQAHSTAM